MFSVFFPVAWLGLPRGRGAAVRFLRCINSMPDIKPGRKSLPLVSDLVSAVRGVKETAPLGAAGQPSSPQPCQRGDGGVPRCFGGLLALLAVGSWALPYPRVLLFNGALVPTPSISLRFPRAASGFPFFYGAVSPVPSCPSCLWVPAAWTTLVLDRQIPVPGEGWQWLFQVAQTLCSCPHCPSVWGWGPPMYRPPSSPWALLHRVTLLVPSRP